MPGRIRLIRPGVAVGLVTCLLLRGAASSGQVAPDPVGTVLLTELPPKAQPAGQAAPKRRATRGQPSPPANGGVAGSPPQVGACCLWDGSCVDNVFQPDCDALGGVYQGDNTVCAPRLCPPTPTGANFFLDPGAFQAALPPDKRAKASWDFKPNNLAPGTGGALDDPVNINWHTGDGGDPWTNTPPPPSGDCCFDHFPGLGCEDPVCEAAVCLLDTFCCASGWDSACAAGAAANLSCDCTTGPAVSKWPPSVDNVTFQSNLGPHPQPPLPNPRGVDGLFFGNGLFGYDNNILVANFFVDSFDILSGPPAPSEDNHTAMSLELVAVLSGPPLGPILVTVYDKLEVPVGKIKVEIPTNPEPPASCDLVGVLPTSDCAGATPIVIGGTAFDDTSVIGVATEIALPTCGTPITVGVPALWYSVVGDGGLITASLCKPGTTYDSKISVYEGPCTDLCCVGGNDDGGGVCGLDSEFTWKSSVGTDYLIMIHGFDGASGAFELNVTSAASPPVAPKKAFLGIIMKPPLSIGRVNIHDLGGGGEGISSFTLYSDFGLFSNADIASPGLPGIPDGCVDGTDLAVLLGTWCSAAGDPDPPGDVDPPCDGCPVGFALADIAGAGFGPPDGCVDGNDLAKLLGEWCSVAGGNPCGTCGR